MSTLPTTERTTTDTGIATAVGKPVDVSEAPQPTLTGTGLGSEYSIRIPIGPIVLNSSSTAGAVLWLFDLDTFKNDPTLASLKLQHMYWTIDDLVLDIKCGTSWSKASGLLKVAYNPDPENPFPTDSIPMATRLAGSVSAMAKSEFSVSIPSSEFKDSVYNSPWRYCKKASASVPRTERFGSIAVIAKSVPDTGDSATFSGSLFAKIKVKDITINSNLSNFKVPVQVDNNDATARIVGNSLAIDLPPLDFDGQTFVSSGLVVFDETARAQLTLSDAAGNAPDEVYSVPINHGTFYATAAGITLIFPSRINSVSNLANPFVDLLLPSTYQGYCLYQSLPIITEGYNVSSTPTRNIPMTLDKVVNSAPYRLLNPAATNTAGFIRIDGVMHDVQALRQRLNQI